MSHGGHSHGGMHEHATPVATHASTVKMNHSMDHHGGNSHKGGHGEMAGHVVRSCKLLRFISNS